MQTVLCYNLIIINVFITVRMGVFKGIKRSLSKIKVNKKYLIATIIFLVFVLVLDSDNLLKRFSLLSEKQELEGQIKAYDEKIIENNRKLKELRTSKENLEKFAREEYYMKNSNEDVYLIEEQED